MVKKLLIGLSALVIVAFLFQTVDAVTGKYLGFTATRYWDNDGVFDQTDAFPDNPSEFRDTDSDGMGDNLDPDADNDGRTFDSAKALISAAHALCTANKSDYIVCLNTAVDGEASYPITVSTDMVHIIGLVRGFASAKEPMIGTTDSAIAMNVTGDGVEIAGFGFCAGSTSACLTMGSLTGVFGVLVRDCMEGHLACRIYSG